MTKHTHIRPQNKSCPAGGTNSTRQGQRGVIVAPPSGNTDHQDPYPILHQGFDTLALSIKANIPPQMFEALERERERAEKEGQAVAIDYNGIPFLLSPHGGKGYRFIANEGPHGAHWFFKKPNGKDPWGIRLSYGSDFLAHYGLGRMTAHLDSALASFGIRYREEDVSLSRIDYCMDILAPDFTLVPENFVMHSSTGRRDFLLDAEKSVHGRSSRVTSVTVGKVNNRQVIIYDKREEVIKRGKVQWWNIWNRALRSQGRPELDPKDPSTSRVWRVELRAGKDLLKDRWNIRTFADFYARFGDMTQETISVTRYTKPCKTDQNRARWQDHPLWEKVKNVIESGTLDMKSNANPERTKEIKREQHISVIFRNILGCSMTLGALNGCAFEDMEVFLNGMARDMADKIAKTPTKYAKMLEDAKARYRFI